MKITNRVRAAITGLIVLAAVAAGADGFEQLDTVSRPTALKSSGGASVKVGGSGDWVYLLHGGLPAVLNARPVGGLWLFDGSEWTEIEVGAPAVYGHWIVAVAEGLAFGFGGSDRNDELRSLGSIMRYRIEHSAAGYEVSIDEIEIPGTSPGSCNEAPVVRLEERDSMLLVGGMCSYFPGRSAEVWEYRPGGNSWHRRADLPRALAGHSAVVEGDQVWVFGGRSGDGMVNEVYRYDAMADEWAVVATSGERPAPVADHRAVVLNGSMLVFGGIREPFWPETIDEVWELDLSTSRWMRKSDLPYGIAEMVVGVIPSGGAGTNGTRVLLQGGVIDAWSFPLVLSDATLIYTSDIVVDGEVIAIPAVARVRGRGAFFTSTFYLLNTGDSDLDLELTFTPRRDFEGGPVTIAKTVAAGAMEVIADPLGALFGLGAGEDSVGSVLMTAQDGSIDNLVVRSRVSAEAASGGIYGTSFPALRQAEGLRSNQVGYLVTTEDPSAYRVNVGLMAMGDSTVIRVTPVSKMGDGLADSAVFALDRGDNTQIDDIHRFFGLGELADVLVEIVVAAGSAVAYATVLDGNGAYAGCSDPTTLLPVTGGSESVTLLEIGSIQGFDEFSGSATIVNHSGFEAEISASFHQRSRPGILTTRSISVAAGTAVGFGDFVAEVFGISGTVGTVVLESTNGAEISAAGREFAIHRDPESGAIVGTAGTQLPGLNDDDLVTSGRPWHLLGLRQFMHGGEKERSHIAVFNPGSEAALVSVRMFNGADGVHEGSMSWAVEGGELVQVDNILKKINSEVNGDEKRVEISVDRPVHLHAFRVNTSGDSVTVRAEASVN